VIHKQKQYAIIQISRVANQVVNEFPLERIKRTRIRFLMATTLD